MYACDSMQNQNPAIALCQYRKYRSILANIGYIGVLSQ